MLNFANTKALIVMAHPDDAEILCFGTLLHLLAAGSTVKLLIASTGTRGLKNNDHLRTRETQAAFANTGVDIEFLNCDDGKIDFDVELISKIDAIAHQMQPNLLITHHVDLTGTEHQDHTAVGKASLNVARRCPSMTTILHPHPYTLKTQVNGFDCFVDVTAVFDRKLAALRCHRSQQHKYYLSPSYQKMLAQTHALAAGYEYWVQGQLLERFQVARCVTQFQPLPEIPISPTPLHHGQDSDMETCPEFCLAEVN